MRILSALFVSFFMCSLMFAEVPKAERDALLDLYRFTNGDSWNNKWDLNADVKNWYGVHVLNDRVVSLNLSMNNLEGELPSTLGNLTRLTNLELFFNKISGELPNQIGLLKNLEVLALNNNMLSGEIPEGVFQLTKLKRLMLTSNHFEGIVSNGIENLKEPEMLSLIDNNPSGQLPEALKTLHKLKKVNVAVNAASDIRAKEDYFVERGKEKNTRIAESVLLD